MLKAFCVTLYQATATVVANFQYVVSINLYNSAASATKMPIADVRKFLVVSARHKCTISLMHLLRQQTLTVLCQLWHFR